MSKDRSVVNGSDGLPLRTRVAHSIFWLTWSRGLVQLLSFATTVLVARKLDPADYGIMALASVFIATSGMLAEMGLGTAIVQFRDLERAELNTCFWITMILAIIACGILALGAPVIAHWFAVPRLADVLPYLALALPLTACSTVYDSLLRKQLALYQEGEKKPRATRAADRYVSSKLARLIDRRNALAIVKPGTLTG